MAITPADNPTLAQLSTEAVAAAIEASQCEFLAGFGRARASHFVDEPDVLYFSTELPFGSCNVICRARFDAQDADGRIDAILSHFRDLGHQANWWVGPSSRPRDLRERLLGFGLTHRIDIQGMAADLDTLGNPSPRLPDGVLVGRVQTIDELRDSFQPYRASYNPPPAAADAWFDYFAQVGFAQDAPLRHYLATLEGRPAAKCTLLLAGGVAGIFDVATMPEARRRGIGTAVTCAALAEARDLGYRVAVLHATEAGAALYRKLHFESYATFSLYVLGNDRATTQGDT